jgi:hypothetical protein
MLNTIVNFLEHNKILLSMLLPLSYTLVLSLTIFLTFFNLKNIAKNFREIKKPTWIFLFLIFTFSFYLRTTTPSYFASYYDELSHINTGKNILEEGKLQVCTFHGIREKSCYTYNEAGGFTFILAIFFFFFEVSRETAYFTNLIFGSLLTLLIFLFTYLLFKKEKIALYSSFIIAILPVYILISRTIEPDTVSTFFGLSTLLFFLLLVKEKSSNLAILSLSWFAFFTQIKDENIILIIPLLILLILTNSLKHIKEYLKDPKFLLLGTILIILIIPHILHSFLEAYPAIFLNKKTAGAPFGSYFNLNQIPKNWWVFGELLKGNYNSLLLNIFVLISFFSFKKYKKEFLFLVLLFFTFSLLYLSYSAGIVEKYLIIWLLPLICLSSLGAEKIDEILGFILPKKISSLIIISLILFLSVPYIYKIKIEPTEMVHHGFGRSELNYPEQEFVNLLNNKINPNCWIITHDPSTFDGTKIKAIGTEIALNTPEKIEKIANETGCIFYFEDLYCTNFYSLGDRCGIENESFQRCEEYRKEIVARCQEMNDVYNLQLYLTYEINVSRSVREGLNQSENIAFKVYKVNTV